MDEVDRAIAELKLKFPGLDEERLARTQETGVDVKAGGGLALGLRWALRSAHRIVLDV